MNHRWNREVMREGNVREELRKLTKRKKKKKEKRKEDKEKRNKSQKSSKPKLYSKVTSYGY